MQPPTKKQLEAAIKRTKKAKKGTENLVALLDKAKKGKDVSDAKKIHRPSPAKDGKLLMTLGPSKIKDRAMFKRVRSKLKKQGS